MNMELRRVYTEAEQALIDGFAPEAGAHRADWAETARSAAMDAFRESGLPHRRVEEWKYTDLRNALREAFPVARPNGAAEAPVNPLADAGFHTLTFVDGTFVSDVPAIDGVSFLPLNDALNSDDPAVKALLTTMPARGSNPVFDLNTATMNFGGVFVVEPGTEITTPIHIRSVVARTEPGSYVSRFGVIVGAGASATLLESFEGEVPDFQRNAAIQVVVGAGATFKHLRVETESDSAIHLSNIVVEIGAEANYSKFGLATGAALMRNDLSIRFNGEHSNANIDSVFLKTGKQHHDTTMYVDHAVPNCTSRELFKSVLGGSARGVFQGKILVRPDAQKTDGAMSANAIILSDQAEMDAKPELEIYADDVVCGHGATSGQLDDELLFFLRARGIPEREAKALLILAFIGEALEDVEDEIVHDHLMDLTRDWIAEADI